MEVKPAKGSKNDTVVDNGETDLQKKPVEEKPCDENVNDLPARLAEKEKEAAENYDRFLRASAEFDNYKKRVVRERIDLIKYGNESLIKDMLPIADSLDRALKHTVDTKDFDAFIKGLQLVQEQFLGCLKNHGVEGVETKGKDFDPNVHEAMLQVESEKYEENKIVEEFEKGYILNGRLLRPAKVSVSKCIKKGNDN